MNGSAKYNVEITRTEFGVPHIKASDYGSLGYGEAYASAQDHVCNMALALISAKGEMSEYLGSGHQGENIHSDLAIRALDMSKKGSQALSNQPSNIKNWIEGYAGGYNRYLRESSGDFNSWCDHADWVRSATPEDFMTQYVALVQTITRMAGAVVAAQPPDEIATIEVSPSQILAAVDAIRLDGMGSNAWAFGTKSTANGRGSLLANPHYPWYGPNRFWEKHLTIPGELNVYGSNLIGTAGVGVGFNEAVGWTHTVSDSKRVVLYRLTLKPDDPTQYLYEGSWRSLRNQQVTTQVKTAEGMETKTTTVWFSHHGPVIEMPGLDWTSSEAYAARDANAENVDVMSQWLAMGKSRSMAEFIEAHKKYNAMPWVNTISTSAEGRAVYLDNTNVGALSGEAISAWRDRIEASSQLKNLYLTEGLVILDGSKNRDEWINHHETPIPGTTPFEQRPLIESEFYVFNANDSYWLSDPKKPTTGYSPLYGATETPRSVRTRMNIHLLEGLDGFNFSGEDGLFSVSEIQAALMDNSGLTAHLLKDELVERCKQSPIVYISDISVELLPACTILSEWDNRYNADSKGAVLFREWLTRYSYWSTMHTGELFSANFDRENPITTPAGLAENQRALITLAEAVTLLIDNGIPLDIPLGELQKAHRAGKSFPVHGGNRYEGIANLQVTKSHIASPVFSGSNERVGDSETLSSSGYNIAHGSSFIMTLNYTENGPDAKAILSYSQSGSPDSQYFSDQTELYRDKVWRDIYFKPSDIAQNKDSYQLLTE
ncbi:MAG: peptidase S45 [Porticoccaceae bacterium]|nr:peptidase S45 [Porticoccaceae bacterium]